MPNIVGISKDEKLLKDIETYCREVVGDELRFASFKSGSEFESLYFKTPTEEEESPPPDTEMETEEETPEGSESEPAELRLFGTVHLVIVAENGLSEKLTEFAPKCLKLTHQFGQWPEGNRTRIIGMRYEEDGMDKVKYLHPALEDMLLLPLDRMLFLQNLEIFLKLPKIAQPSYLYSQETHDEMEISKIVMLERINDCALAIRNKAPLKIGVRGKFYVKPPNSKNFIRFFGKVFRNEPDPEHPGEFLVYFFFFGARKSETTTIRGWLGSDPKYHSFLTDHADAFKLNPDDLFLTDKDRESYSVAIVDNDDHQSQTLADTIESNMDRISVVQYSYSLFHDVGLSESGDLESFVPNPSEAKDLPGETLKIEVERDTKKIIDVSPDPSEESFFCGHPTNEIFLLTQNNWWSLFELTQNNSFFKDALMEKKSTKILFAKSSKDQWIGFLVDFENHDESRISLTFSPIDSDTLLNRMPKAKALEALSALIIDTTLVSEDFEPWLSALTEKTLRKGVIKKPADLKLIFISDREDQLRDEWLNCSHVIAFLIKPIDTKSICAVLAEALNNKNTKYTFTNLGWIKPSMRLHLSKPAELDHLGEFGATICTTTPFKEGSFFFLRKGIFDEAPNGCLAARVYKTEPHPSEDGKYLVHTTYFGINDHFLKHARSFMREMYAQSKNKEG